MRLVLRGLVRQLADVAVAALVIAIVPASNACSDCPDERRREEPELPPRKEPCVTSATPSCVFDPHLPGDPTSPEFHAGVGETPEQRLERWLAQSCEFICSRLSDGFLRSCEAATRRADGVYRVTCDVEYDTCHDTRM